MWKVERALFLAPHTDDYELGAGGTVHRLLAQGTEVRAIAFSTARESLPAGWAPDTLDRECRAAAECLGLPHGSLEILDYPVRRFPALRQEILEHLVAVQRSWNPDLVFVNSTTDIHQDHATMTQEALRAFKKSTILGYELPWNNIQFNAQSLVGLQEVNMSAKIAAVRAYGVPAFPRLCLARRWSGALP